MNILIETSDQSFYERLRNQNIEGLTVKVRTRDSLSEVASSLLPLIVMVDAQAIPLLVDWLYNELKDKTNHQTMINGNQINIENINITYITQVIESKKTGKSSKKSSKKSKKR